MVAYATYKGDCNSIFVLNLSPINAYVTCVYVFVCINALVSYPLQILAAFDIAEQHRYFKTGDHTKAFAFNCTLHYSYIIEIQGEID